MTRGWLLSTIAVGVVLGLVFAVFPVLDLDIAGWFFNATAGFAGGFTYWLLAGARA